MSAPQERGADLLERLLHAHGAGPDELAQDSAERAELEELAAFVGRCRETREAFDGSLKSTALVQRVFERTTREDPGLFGDLRLVRSFVGRRLETSALLRVVAASLLIHLIALPVVAWFVLDKTEEQGISFTIAHEPESVFEPQELERVELDFEVDDVQAEADRLEGRTHVTYAEPWDVANALAADRYLLQARAGDSPSFEAPTDPALIVLAGRLAVGGSGIDESAETTAESSDPLVRILRVELELDRLALGRETGSELQPLLDALDDVVPAAEGEPADEELLRLVKHARQRARAYGVLPLEPGYYGRAWTLSARDGRGLGPDLTALLERRGGRLEAREWGATLAAILARRGLAEHPAAQAWAPR